MYYRILRALGLLFQSFFRFDRVDSKVRAGVETLCKRQNQQLNNCKLTKNCLGRRKFLINKRNTLAKLQNDSLLFNEWENQSSNSEYYYRPINEINIAEVVTLDMNNRQEIMAKGIGKRLNTEIKWPDSLIS